MNLIENETLVVHEEGGGQNNLNPERVPGPSLHGKKKNIILRVSIVHNFKCSGTEDV